MSLKLEAGKYYRKRDGQKVYVAAVGCPFAEAELTQALGWCEDGSDLGWAIDGRFYPDGQATKYDIIAEWRDPVKVMVYVFKHPSGSVIASHSPDYCDAHWTIIAQREITEGEGMDAAG